MLEASARERRWTAGSYTAAGFALFILLYNLTYSLYTFSIPTDGWLFTEDSQTTPQSFTFTYHFLNEPSLIAVDDRLFRVNGQPVDQIMDAGHNFLSMNPPDWPDGTLLTYEVERAGERIVLEVPIRRISAWQYYSGYLSGHGNSEGVTFVTGLLFFAIGCFVFLLRPSNRAAHALLLLGVGFLPFTGNYSVPTLFHPIPPPSIPLDNWTLVVNPSLMYLLLAFPYPKMLLRRFPIPSVLLIFLPWPLALNLAYFLNMQDRAGFQQAAFTIYPVQIACLMVVTVGALVHTALTVRDAVGRSQLKWMMAGVGSFVFVGVGGWLISSYLFPDTIMAGNWLITTVGWLLMPICLAVAITRYRLFDIDLIIRRTLQYSLLTGLLALVYYGGTILFQWIFRGFGSMSSSPAAIVLSTLAIAALFNPLRLRLQNIIDRRFYRQKYNTENVLAAFSGTLRNEMELDYLSNSIMKVVDDVIQPTHVALWFCKTPGKDQAGSTLDE